jgi:hypothetical protein
MSTDRVVPERWRVESLHDYQWAVVDSDDAVVCICNKEEHARSIATAESLVRDLSGVLNLCHPFVSSKLQGEIRAALSRIPKELQSHD